MAQPPPAVIPYLSSPYTASPIHRSPRRPPPPPRPPPSGASCRRYGEDAHGTPRPDLDGPELGEGSGSEMRLPLSPKSNFPLHSPRGRSQISFRRPLVQSGSEGEEQKRVVEGKESASKESPISSRPPESPHAACRPEPHVKNPVRGLGNGEKAFASLEWIVLPKNGEGRRIAKPVSVCLRSPFFGESAGLTLSD